MAKVIGCGGERNNGRDERNEIVQRSEAKRKTEMTTDLRETKEE